MDACTPGTRAVPAPARPAHPDLTMALDAAEPVAPRPPGADRPPRAARARRLAPTPGGDEVTVDFRVAADGPTPVYAGRSELSRRRRPPIRRRLAVGRLRRPGGFSVPRARHAPSPALSLSTTACARSGIGHPGDPARGAPPEHVARRTADLAHALLRAAHRLHLVLAPDAATSRRVHLPPRRRHDADVRGRGRGADALHSAGWLARVAVHAVDTPTASARPRTAEARPAAGRQLSPATSRRQLTVSGALAPDGSRAARQRARTTSAIDARRRSSGSSRRRGRLSRPPG
jgi:hypothetical protein